MDTDDIKSGTHNEQPYVVLYPFYSHSHNCSCHCSQPIVHQKKPLLIGPESIPLCFHKIIKISKMLFGKTLMASPSILSTDHQIWINKEKAMYASGGINYLTMKPSGASITNTVAFREVVTSTLPSLHMISSTVAFLKSYHFSFRLCD